MTNYVFVINADKIPLNPVHPATARRLLKQQKAAVFRRYPFTLIMRNQIVSQPIKPLQLKLDPGSRVTGIALVEAHQPPPLNPPQGGAGGGSPKGGQGGVPPRGQILWAAELTHRGTQIKNALLDRRTMRRSRRNRQTRYRQARFLNRTRVKGWLSPSLNHLVKTTLTWVRRLSKYSPVGMIAMELVKFDPQVLQNPEINGVEYQQGELQGYEVREYLLQKWGRKCVYCSRENIPLEIEHIIPRSHGGSNRVSNLTLACRQCNQAKGNQELKDFLSEKSSLLEYIQAQSKKSLKDAAVVNSSRWSLFNELKNTGVLVTTGTGGQTKYNRTKLSLPKKHWIDAGCVGDVNELILLTQQPLLIEAKGHGSRQMCRTDKYGFPVAHKERRANLFGWKTGDLARAVIPKGKYTGYYPIGRVVAKKGSFLFAPPGVKGKDRISVNHKYLMPIHRRDGYAYSYS